MMKVGKRQCLRNVDTIVTRGNELAAKITLEATGGPNYDCSNRHDPLTLGYVASVARPGGSVTGLFAEQIGLPAQCWAAAGHLAGCLSPCTGGLAGGRILCEASPKERC